MIPSLQDLRNAKAGTDPVAHPVGSEAASRVLIFSWPTVGFS